PAAGRAHQQPQLRALLRKQTRDVAANETGGACNKDFHWLVWTQRGWGGGRCALLLQLLLLGPDVFFAGLTFFPILAHPRLPAAAGGGIASAKREPCNLGVGDAYFLVASRRKDADKRILQVASLAAIEDIALDLASILQTDSHVAAVIESLVEREPHLVVAGKLRNPALQIFPLYSRGDFQLIGIVNRS